MPKSERKPLHVTPPPTKNAEELPQWAHRQFLDMQALINELLERVEALESP